MNLELLKEVIKTTYHAARGELERAKCNLCYVLGIYKLILKAKRKKGIKLIILAYHSVTKNRVKYKGLQVGIKNFEKQIRFLKRNFDIIPIEKAVEGIEHNSSKTRNKVVITFDDGYRNNYDIAYPVLQKYQVSATIFVTTQPIERQDQIWTNKLRAAIELTTAQTLRIGEDEILGIGSSEEKKQVINYLTKKLKAVENTERLNLLDNIHKQIGRDTLPGDDYEMLTIEQVGILSNNGISFQSHSCTHPIVSKLKEAEFEEELVESRQKIAQWSGNDVFCFAYPNGKKADFCEESKRILMRAGFKVAFTLIRGTNDSSTDRYEMKRIPIKDSNLPEFISYLLRYI